MKSSRSPPRYASNDNNDQTTDDLKDSNKRIELLDEHLGGKLDDPRIDLERNVKVSKMKGVGRNTESFDPKSTLVRPSLRIVLAANQPELTQIIKHDDVIIVPEFFCKENDWDIYYKLVEEMRELQSKNVKNSEWISWHEGAHLISNNPSESKTFQEIQSKISKYFGINNNKVGTRFNWYRDSSDWKPFHHDSAAFNPMRARNQNITVGVSFGSTRELAFLHAKNGTRVYFPQTNGMMFSFGRDVNINWKHGINALHEEDKDGKGRISIVLWGLCPKFTEEEGSPPMLSDNTRGNGHHMHHNNNRNNNDQNSRKGRRDDSRDRRGDDRRNHNHPRDDRGDQLRRENGSHNESRGHHQRSDSHVNGREAATHFSDRPRERSRDRNVRNEPSASGGARYERLTSERDAPRSREAGREYERRDDRDGQQRTRGDSRSRNENRRHNTNQK